MSEPDREPTDGPTEDKAQAEREGKEMARNWIGIAAVSILALLLLALVLMQVTGLIDVFDPLTAGHAQQWAGLAVVALVGS